MSTGSPNRSSLNGSGDTRAEATLCVGSAPTLRQLTLAIIESTLLVEEDDVAVEVLILICDDTRDRGEAMDCPVHVYLSRELGQRLVFDAARGGAEVERYTPDW